MVGLYYYTALQVRIAQGSYLNRALHKDTVPNTKTQYESALLVERWTISLDLEILLHYTLVMILMLSPTGHGSPLTQARVHYVLKFSLAQP